MGRWLGLVAAVVVSAWGVRGACGQGIQFTDDLGGVGSTSTVLFRPGGQGMALPMGPGTRPPEPPQTATTGGGGTGGGLVDQTTGATVGQCWIQINGWISDNGIATKLRLEVDALASYDPSQWIWSGSSLIGTVGFPLNTVHVDIPGPRRFSVAATGDITPGRFTLHPRSEGAGINGDIINPGHYQVRYDDFSISASPSQPTRTVSGTWTLRLHCCCPADWDESGTVTSTDISVYLTAWIGNVWGGGLGADFNGDGAVNSTDISAFLGSWLGAADGEC